MECDTNSNNQTKHTLFKLKVEITDYRTAKLENKTASEKLYNYLESLG